MILENADLGAAEHSDITIFTIGYEPRSTHIARSVRMLPDKAYAIGYNHSKVLQYRSSLELFAQLGCRVMDDVDDSTYGRLIHSILADHPGAHSVCVDISSLNRRRIAAWIELAHARRRACPFRLSLLYCPSEFVKPAAEIVQNEYIGPVSLAFSGTLEHLDRPPALIVGLGYELGKALGAVEYLQCSATWLLIPRSHEGRFEDEVRRVNRVLLQQISSDRVLTYDLEDPVGTFADICSLLRGVSQWSDPVLLPLGPKLFALLCMIAGLQFQSASIWRATQGVYEVAIARRARGDVVGVSFMASEQVGVGEMV